MPQTTELPLFKAAYPILAPAQKPGGVTVSTTLWSKAVPNKPQWTGTQMAAEEEQPAAEETVAEEVQPDENVEPVEEEEVEEEAPHPHGKKPSRRKR